jgi:electron transport complex protein RnfG
MQNKKKSTLIKDAVALFLITLISGLALSYVYEITKDPIATQQAQKTLEAYQRAYPEAASFEKDEQLMQLAEETDLKSLDPSYQGTSIDEINKAFDSNGDMIGYLIKVSTKKGYNKSTPVEMAIAYAKDGTVKGIDIITIKETVNLGMLAAEPEFKDQFAGKNVEKFSVTKTGEAGDDKIDAISGATITSKAVTNAVNTGIGFVKKFATDLGGAANE